MSLTLLEGDCRTLLPTLPAESVQCVVTSPPYWGLRDYGVEGQIGLESTPEAYLATIVAVFREVRRVLRDDGTCWVNMGDSYASPLPRIAYGDQASRGPGAQEGDRTIVRDWSAIGLKEKDLAGMPWRLALALQADGWFLRADIIWAKPNPMPVLDPFAGSGTVGEVAEANGRDAVLIELSPAYVELARDRTAQRGLFASRDACGA